MHIYKSNIYRYRVFRSFMSIVQSSECLANEFNNKMILNSLGTEMVALDRTTVVTDHQQTRLK